MVRLAPEERESIEQLRSLRLRGVGGTVRLEEVADIGPERTPNLIARENAQRKAVISCNVAEGYNLGDLVAQVQARVDPIVQRAGYAVHYGGQFEAQQSASRTILVAGVGVAVVMLMLLQLSTGSLRAALLVMVNLPLAIIGGIVAIYVTEAANPLTNTLSLFGLTRVLYQAPVISIASLVGFITLFRDCRPQWTVAGQPLSAPHVGRGKIAGRRHRSWLHGAIGSHPHDRIMRLPSV